MRAVEERYADLNLGLADGAIVVLARRLQTRAVLTSEERHFRAVEPLRGGAFTLLPTTPERRRITASSNGTAATVTVTAATVICVATANLASRRRCGSERGRGSHRRNLPGG